MNQTLERIHNLLFVALTLAAMTPVLADPLDISIGPATPLPAYLGTTTTLPITIEPTISTHPVTGVSATLAGGFSAQPVSWNFDLVSHTCPGTLTPTTSPVRGVTWTGIDTVSSAASIQCEIEIRPRADLGSPSNVTLRLSCTGCAGDSDDRATTEVQTGVAGDIEVTLSFNESQQVGTVSGSLTYRNIGLGDAENLTISLFGNPALFVNLNEIGNQPGCNENAQVTSDSRSWTKTRLRPGEEVRCQFETTIPAPGSYALSGLATGLTVDGLDDPWPDNNSDTVTMTATEFVVDIRFSFLPDANPGDGVCADSNGDCSLRAAVDETNALPGRQTILVPYQAGGYFLGGLSSELQINEAVILSGLPDPITNARPWITRSDSDDAGLIWVATPPAGPESEIRNLDLRGNPTNQLSVDGAVIRQTGPLLISNTTISDGWTSGDGGGLRGGTGLRLRKVEIFDNRATLGGGLFLSAANNPSVTDASLIDVAVHDNLADTNGGGLFSFFATTTIDRSAFYRNEAVRGGGFYFSSGAGTLITNSTIAENDAALQGGGAYQLDGARATILDYVTMAYNEAGPGDTAVGDGGGVYVDGFGNFEIRSSILTFNFARTTGGPFGTIISGNCSGMLNTQGFNTISWLDGDPDCAVTTPQPTDDYNATPGLGALTTVEGGMAYYPLTRVNNEIDQGSSTCSFFPEPYHSRDVLFQLRPFDANADGLAECDRGAYETRPFLLDVGTTNSPGALWQIDLDSGLPPCSDAECLYAGIAPGTFITLSAAPGPGTVFDGWGGACSTSGTGDCTLDMTQSRAVTASFSELPSFPLSVSRVGSGSVTSTPAGIDCPNSCVADFIEGTTVTLSAVSAPGFEPVVWSGACSGTGPCQVTMNQARNATATFAPSDVPLLIRMDGPGTGRVVSSPAGIDCTSDCSASFPPATTVDLTATPDAGIAFQNWTGACSGNAACSVSLTEATTVGAVWADDESIFIDGME